MQARNQEPGGMLIGAFVGLSDRQQTLNCDDMMGVSPVSTHCLQGRRKRKGCKGFGLI